MNFNPMQCTICNDKRHFDMKVNDARRIMNSLNQLIAASDIEYELTTGDEREINRIQCKTHQHFMCGHCHKVNENELWNVEDQLKQTAYTLYMISKAETLDDNKGGYVIHSCQRLLSGFYPALARLFYRQ